MRQLKNRSRLLKNFILTLVGLGVAYILLAPLIKFALIDAVWTGTDWKACLGLEVGACWAFVGAYLEPYFYGAYPSSEYWRIDLVLGTGIFFLAAIMIPALPFKKFTAVLLLIVFPLCAWLLVTGQVYQITATKYPRAGGLSLTIIAAFLGGALTVLIGVPLAYARNCWLPAFRWLAIGFIEFWRGIPAIVIIFASAIMLPLFVPEDVSINKLLRMAIALALISAPYLADEVGHAINGQSNMWRGVLPKGDLDRAQPGGKNLSTLACALPGSIHVLIDLLKNTTILHIAGGSGLLSIVQISFTDARWATPVTASSAYLFTAIIFLGLCFPLSGGNPTIFNGVCS